MLIFIYNKFIRFQIFIENYIILRFCNNILINLKLFTNIQMLFLSYEKLSISSLFNLTKK